MEVLVLTVNRNVIVTIVSVAQRLGAVFVEQACGEDIVISVSNATPMMKTDTVTQKLGYSKVLRTTISLPLTAITI